MPIRSAAASTFSSRRCSKRRGGPASDVDLAQLIQDINRPPISKVGAVDLESFYPAKDRTKLAMSLNNLLASPSFAGWLEGEPLDIQRILYTPDGKPRLAIVSIAHLDDAQRMFFVTILLNEILAWIRTQPGTSSLRAMLYMDEVFGYFPPLGNPPAKRPMLTLLKQARAFGLGCVLATQNPVDLDYKGSVERRHVVSRPAANRARQGPRDRRAGRRVGAGGRDVQSAGDGGHARGARQPRVPDEQRARRCAGRVSNAVGDVVLVRPAHDEPDQDADGSGAVETSVGERLTGAPPRC